MTIIASGRRSTARGPSTPRWCCCMAGARAAPRRSRPAGPTPVKTALEDRIAALGHSGSWPEIIADLDSLTETEIEYDGKRFIVRSAPRPAASLALRAAGVALPPTVRDATAS